MACVRVIEDACGEGCGLLIHVNGLCTEKFMIHQQDFNYLCFIKTRGL